MDPGYELTRVRHPLRYRRVIVARVEALTPAMRRFVLTGEDLDGFTSASFDDHVKVFFPGADGRLPVPLVGENGVSFPGAPKPPDGRDFTPRHFDAARRELTLDIGLHSDGPASRWARTAAAGSSLGIAGPRGSAIVPETFAWNLLVGDETALPAIARRLDELPADVAVMAIIEVDDPSSEIRLATSSNAHVMWLHREGGPSDQVDLAVGDANLPAGVGFAWVAGEAAMARRIRRLLIDRRGLHAAHVKAAAYWTRGGVSRHEVFSD